MPSPPLVTIGLPVLNAEATLPAAIESIRMQSFTDWELLVIDDGSIDRSPELAMKAAAQDTRIHALCDGLHVGLAARLNQVVQAARGRLFARMDADDIAYPNRLRLQVDFLTAQPDVDLVGGAMLVFGERGVARGVRRGPTTHGAICSRPHWGFRMFHPTWTGRTTWFSDHGYRPSPTEDQDLLFRAHRTSRYANLPEVLAGYREPGIKLGPSLRRRRAFTGRTVRALLANQHRGAALSSLSKHLALGLVDIVAVTLSLEDKLLRQRAGSMSAAELNQWSLVWRQINHLDAIS
jgi:glycosyltransferase involved in cell wall biosynthesis